MFLKMDTSRAHLEKLCDPDLLPDGRKFEFWDCETEFTKTLVVDQGHPAAADENDGSENAPFKTVSAAARRVRPGERILIKKGRYFETVREIRGGTDAKHMVLIEGEEGAVITGAIHWNPGFVPSSGYRQTPVLSEYGLFHADRSTMFAQNGAKVWMGDIPSDGNLYEYGFNPFFAMNLHSMAWVPTRNSYARILDEKVMPHMNRDEHIRKRGEVYADGRRLHQAVRYFELFEQEDVFFVDEAYKRIHFRLRGDQDPHECRFEITLKEQGFMPNETGLGYICFKNLAFEKFANPVKWPQLGALSCNCGHHFIVENCRFSDIHSVALDMGYMSHNLLHDGVRGHCIVRGNLFERCGISSMCATPTMGEYMDNLLVENNTLVEIGYLDLKMLYETAAIKSHFTRDSLFRNNFMLNCQGSGIWLDNHNWNTRITNNIILNLASCPHGAIFNEATLNTVLIDHNFVADVGCHIDPTGEISGGHGLYQHACENTVVWENVCVNAGGDCVHFAYAEKPTRYMYENKRPALNRLNIAIGNLLSNGEYGVNLSGTKDESHRNLIQSPRITQLYIAAVRESHTRESVAECYGYEQEDSPAAAFTYENGVLEVKTVSGKTLSFIPEKGASVPALFRSLNGVK